MKVNSMLEQDIKPKPYYSLAAAWGPPDICFTDRENFPNEVLSIPSDIEIHLESHTEIIDYMHSQAAPDAK